MSFVWISHIRLINCFADSLKMSEASAFDKVKPYTQADAKWLLINGVFSRSSILPFKRQSINLRDLNGMEKILDI